jgi:hypothetical protein
MEDLNSPQTPKANINTVPAPQPPKKKSGAGKKVLAVLAVLLLMGASAGAAYYITKEQAEDDAAAIIEPLVAQLEEIAAAQAAAAAAESESAESAFLEVKQWNVKLTPTDSAMTYSIKTVDGNQVAYLTNAAVKDIKGCEDAELAAIGRYDAKQTNEATAGEFVAEVDSYFYYVSGSNGTCATDEADQKLEVAQRDALRAAAKTLESSKE